MASCQQAESPTTTTAAQADIGPILEQLPANPRQVVIMRPGPHPPPNAIHQEFLEEQPSYVAGSHGPSGRPPVLVLWARIRVQHGYEPWVRRFASASGPVEGFAQNLLAGALTG